MVTIERTMRILLVKPSPTLGSILGLQGFSLLEPLELGLLAAAIPPRHEVRVLDLRLARWPRGVRAAAGNGLRGARWRRDQ